MRKLLLIVLALGIMTSPVEAQEIVKNGPDSKRVTKKQYNRAVKKHGRKRVNRNKTHFRVKRSSQQQLMGGRRCSDREWDVYAENFLGWDVWSHTQRVDWCWRANGRIRSVSWTSRVWTAWWTNWEWRGVQDRERWGGVGKKRAGQYIQGNFRWCFTWWCKNDHPWHWTEVRAGAPGWGSVKHRGGWEATS